MLALILTSIRRTFVAAALLSASFASSQLTTPDFSSDPSVHDPSVIKVGERYYVFGSHLAAAWTDDLMNWTQISTNAGAGNTLIPNFAIEMAEALAWASTDTFWAPDVFELPDGRFYMYYCAARSDSPRASLGLAVSDSVEGPYENLGIMLQSGMWGLPSPDGTIYDATVHPNTIDPCLFYDAAGALWMAYGSYSGGVFILEMDSSTGFPLPNQGYGKKLIGGNHSRIEGAYVLYYPETEYYYLFLSFGGLAADGGYNVRVARSRSPDGPYRDAAGTDMTNVAGAPDTLFDDVSIAPHGVKLMGNWKFLTAEGEPLSTSQGYVSPGHNSAYFDADTGKTYLFFHTRFEGSGELHEVRVHQMYFNEDDWPVVAPFRYAGETLGIYQKELCYGSFKVIEHGKDISSLVKESRILDLTADGLVSGYKSGSWELIDGRDLRINLSGVEYRGVLSHQWDNDNEVWVIAFSALSGQGDAIWGSKVATSLSFIEQWRLRHFGTFANTGDAADFADVDKDGQSNLLEYATGSDPWLPNGSSVAMRVDSTGWLEAVFERVFDPDLVYKFEVSPSLGSDSWNEIEWTARGDGVAIQEVGLISDRLELFDAQRYWRLRIERQRE